MNTQTTITAGKEIFIVSAKLAAERTTSPWDKDNRKVNKFKVSIKVGDKRTSFDFYGSINDCNNGVIEMQENDLKHALYCFVSDSCSAKDTFENFCGEFGYDTDSRSAERIYKACVKSLEKYERLTAADIYEVVNELND